MKTRSLLLGAAASLAMTSSAFASNGYYVSLEGGANWIQDWDHTRQPAGVPASATWDTGWAALAAVGYSFGNWRGELEFGYRDNDLDTYTDGGEGIANNAGDLREYSAMANVLYDLPITNQLSVSLGAGAGAVFEDIELSPPTVTDDNWNFAYQGIAGLNYTLSSKLDLFVNYRYFRVSNPEFDFNPIQNRILEGDDIVKHTATIGLRYHFGAPAAAPMVAPPPPPPPEPAAAPKEFIVFFGHNKSNLTPEAMDVIKQAAAAAKQYGSSTITVVGHADRSGSPKYNQGLSLRRGNAVKGALVGEGISDGSISVSGKGESDPMVPTADGVREPQNRRVHINL